MKKSNTMDIDEKELEEFKNKIAVKEEGESPIGGQEGRWVTKDRGDFISLAGGVTEDELFELLFKYGITENIFSTFGQGNPVNVGYSPSENKWYGWSHRAIFGFTEGSTSKFGTVQFSPSNKEEFKNDLYRFWVEEEVDIEDHVMEETEKDGKEGIYLTLYSDNGVCHEQFYEYPEEWGKGEWTAKTMEDAKEMAMDFAENIS